MDWKLTLALMLEGHSVRIPLFGRSKDATDRIVRAAVCNIGYPHVKTQWKKNHLIASFDRGRA